MAVHTVLDHMLALHPKVIDLSLKRIEKLLGKMGNPHKHLPLVIHVAGTNGKGSSVAMLHAIYEAAGYRVHRYISPHLVRFNERITLAGQEVPDDILVAALQQTLKANGNDSITFFEITTAAAFTLFASHPADVLLLETGLGGRLDATNVVESPLCCLITPVSFDHREYLGNTLQAIAGEKAGIIKAGVPVISAPQPAPVRNVLASHAISRDAPLFMGDIDWKTTPAPDSFQWQGLDGQEKTFPLPSLSGEHQVTNAGGVLAVLEACQHTLPVSDASITQGLAKTHWPARMQRLASGTLSALLPQGWQLWLDGSHNPAGGETLAHTLIQAQQQGRAGNIHLVIGMLGTKDLQHFAKPLQGLCQSVTCIPIPGQAKALSADTLASQLTAMGFSANTALSAPDALQIIARHGIQPAQQAAPTLVVITGSLYLAGHILAEYS